MAYSYERGTKANGTASADRNARRQHEIIICMNKTKN